MNAYLTLRKSFFTLLELLVVLTIIMILASLLLPMLKKAKEKGNLIACLGNEKQISMGIFMYTADHNGILPQTTCSAWNDMNWVGQVKSYVTNSQTNYFDKKKDMVFKCSASDFMRDELFYAFHSSYGFYFPLSGKKIMKIKTPSQVIMVGDYGKSGTGTNYSWYPAWLRIYSDTAHCTSALYHYPLYNGTFLDGSGKSVKYALVSIAAYSYYPENRAYPLKVEEN
jgi:competence protein ComGC